jgi:branched-chain amino acid transport system ATP-binding protein
MSNMLLSLESVSVKYGRSEAVRHVSIAIAEGSCVTVIGANGAGKSTLLKSIAGIVPLSGGTMSYDSSRINSTPSHKRVRAGIALVPEGRQVIPSLTVEENLLLGGWTRRRADVQERLAAMYDRFPLLADRMSAAAGSLSGGQQQILVIARGLMSSPRLLLLDEPSLGLSPVMVDEVYEVIAGLVATAATTVLLVEQNAFRALRAASEAYVLELGEIVRSGPAKELQDDARVREAYLGGAST